MIEDRNSNKPVTLKLTAKPGTHLRQLFAYLQVHGLDLHPQIVQTLFTHHLAMILPVDDPAARDFALTSAHLLEAQAKIIRDRFNLKTAPIAVVNSLATSDCLTTNGHRDDLNLEATIKPEGFSFKSDRAALDLEEPPEQLEQPILNRDPVDPRKSKLEEMGINLG